MFHLLSGRLCTFINGARSIPMLLSKLFSRLTIIISFLSLSERRLYFSVKFVFTCAPRDASMLKESTGSKLLHRSVSCDEAVPKGGHNVNVTWPQLVHRIRRTARAHLHIMARQLHPLGEQLLAACSAHKFWVAEDVRLDLKKIYINCVI